MNLPTAQAGFVLNLALGLLLHLFELPEVVAPARPLWLPMFIAYWALRQPQLPILSASLLCGLCMDVLFSAALGQHALALVAVAFVVLRLRSLLTVFPPLQAAGVLVPVWAVYIFILFWIDGTTQHLADPWQRWLPLLATAVAWPLVARVMDQVGERRRTT